MQIATPAAFRQLGQRQNQEDALFPDVGKADKATRLFVVCDGVGGQNDGELASASACRTLGRLLGAKAKRRRGLAPEDVQKAVVQACREMAKAHLGEAATTLTLLALSEDGALLAHVGDSRIYHIRRGEGVVFRTRDHSLVQDYLEAGLITEEEARVHPQRNVITRALHAERHAADVPKAAVTLRRDVQEGDLFLLCTDGVYGSLSEAELLGILTTPTPLPQRAEALAAATHASSDNNTAILVEVEAAQPPADGSGRCPVARVLHAVKRFFTPQAQ